MLTCEQALILATLRGRPTDANGLEARAAKLGLKVSQAVAIARAMIGTGLLRRTATGQMTLTPAGHSALGANRWIIRDGISAAQMRALEDAGLVPEGMKRERP